MRVRLVGRPRREGLDPRLSVILAIPSLAGLVLAVGGTMARVVSRGRYGWLPLVLVGLAPLAVLGRPWAVLPRWAWVAWVTCALWVLVTGGRIAMILLTTVIAEWSGCSPAVALQFGEALVLGQAVGFLWPVRLTVGLTVACWMMLAVGAMVMGGGGEEGRRVAVAAPGNLVRVVASVVFIGVGLRVAERLGRSR